MICKDAKHCDKPQHKAEALWNTFHEKVAQAGWHLQLGKVLQAEAGCTAKAAAPVEEITQRQSACQGRPEAGAGAQLCLRGHMRGRHCSCLLQLLFSLKAGRVGAQAFLYARRLHRNASCCSLFRGMGLTERCAEASRMCMQPCCHQSSKLLMQQCIRSPPLTFVDTAAR